MTDRGVIKLLLEADDVLTTIADGCEEYYSALDDATCLVFDNDFIKEIRILVEKIDTWKRYSSDLEN